MTPVKERQFELSLTGAVWSLDGSEEILQTENTNLSVDKDLRCEQCPYKNKSKNVVVDIENIHCIERCIGEGIDGPSAKKIKLNDIPTNILKNDPHDQSPVKIPIGADFMGKCPYLESQIALSKSLNGSSDESQPDYLKCPFLFENILTNNALDSTEEVSCIDQKEDNLFCGLVRHKEASACGMELARKLGMDLARNLMSKGALDVMGKAQDIIHSQTVTNVKVSS